MNRPIYKPPTQMKYFLIKRKYSDTYYTVRNEHNIPSIIAFTENKRAKRMLAMIKQCEVHKQPLVVEHLDREFVLRTCNNSCQPLIIFLGDSNLPCTLTEEVNPFPINIEEATFYLENKFMYY